MFLMCNRDKFCAIAIWQVLDNTVTRISSVDEIVISSRAQGLMQMADTVKSYTTSNRGWYHKILTKLILKSLLDNAVTRGYMLKFMSTIIHFRSIINFEVDKPSLLVLFIKSTLIDMP